jgi:hypothetical protein
MRQIYKSVFSYIKKTTVVLAALTMFLPLSVSALNSKNVNVNQDVKAPTTSPFCTNLPTETANINSKLSVLIANANQNWSTKNQKWQTIWTNVDQNVANERAKADATRQAEFTKLQAKAKNSSEQQAVTNYIDAVNNAVSIRRQAYDSARQTFRSSVEAAINARQSIVTQQFDTLQNTVNSAVSIAQASCTSDPSSGQSVHSLFQSTLRNAQATFQSDRKSDATIVSQVKSLAATRNNAFTDADQTFKNTITSARQTLIQAFTKSANNASAVN